MAEYFEQKSEREKSPKHFKGDRMSISGRYNEKAKRPGGFMKAQVSLLANI